jgi:hypothetical protein
MATKLIKDLTRETLAVTNSKNEIQIVTLKAGDILEFRSKGRRFRYEVSLQACYYMSVIQTMQRLYQEKLTRYIELRKSGKKCKRPRPLPPIFSPKLYEALRIK